MVFLQSVKSYDFTPQEWGLYIAKQTIVYQFLFSVVIHGTEVAVLRGAREEKPEQKTA